MALKKPSELLDVKESSESFLDNSVQKFVEQPELNSFSEVFDLFKNNISNIEVLSGKVEEIQAEVKSLLTREDLERAMVSQLLVLEQSIRDVQDKVKGINESNLKSIKRDIAVLSSSVNDFVEVEVPKYKKISVESEFRIGKNFSQLENNVNKSLDVINEFVENKYKELEESLEGINEQSLSGIVDDFKSLENIINEFKTNDIPKYKKFIVSSEKRSETLVNEKLDQFDIKVQGNIDSIDEKLDQFDSKVQGNIDSIDAKVVSEISTLNDKFLEFREEDIPRYKKFIVDTEKRTESKLKEFGEETESKLKEFGEETESKLKEFGEDFDSKINQSNKSITDLDKKFFKLSEEDIPKYKNFIVGFEIKNDKNLKEFGEKLDDTTFSILEKISLIDRDHTDIRDLITSKVNEINDLTSEVNDLVSTVELSEDKFKKSIEKKVSDLEIEVIRNESHLKTQNENLEKVQEDIKSSLTGLSDLVEECDKNNYDLGKKIKYLEEVFTKFDEKEILTEGLLDSPNETNSDPLTPTDQNFVTLDQLQEHYKLFVNRIQQQLSTLGGGGETRLEFLDDVNRNSAKVDGKFLKYQSSTGKWVGADAGVDLSQTQIFTGGIAEKFQTGTTLAADNTLALSDGNVIRRTSNESGNQTVNFTGVHSTLSNGEVVSFTVIITPNGSGVINAVQIDGQAITVSWSGGSAPSAGSSGKDVYTFSIFKTGTGVSDYEVYGAATNYA